MLGAGGHGQQGVVAVPKNLSAPQQQIIKQLQ